MSSPRIYRLSSSTELELLVEGEVSLLEEEEQGTVVEHKDDQNLLQLLELQNVSGRIRIRRRPPQQQQQQRETFASSHQTIRTESEMDPEVSSNSDNEAFYDASQDEAPTSVLKKAISFVLPDEKKMTDITPTKEMMMDTSSNDDNDGVAISGLQQSLTSPPPTLSILSTAVQAVVKTNTLKRNIPEHLRQKRLECRTYLSSSSSLSTQGLSVGPPPTPLHRLCAQPSVSLTELWTCCQAHPRAVQQVDAHGRYPLHVLGDNETLITADRITATTFATHLMNEYPAALTAVDVDGHVPFAALLADWIQWAHDQEKLKSSYKLSSVVAELGDNDDQDDNPLDEPLDEDEEYDRAIRSDWNSAYYPGSTSSKRLVFPRVEIWDEIEWCFRMLSTAIDILGRNKVLPTFQNTRDAFARTKQKKKKTVDERNVLVETLVKKLPKLFPTVLLVDEDGMDSRERSLEMKLFRRMLLCPAVVGKWLTNMFNHGGVPARRGVDFLELVSCTKIDDYTGGFGAALPSDWRKFRKMREGVFDSISHLRGGVACLVTLRLSEIERAASTTVVWHSMGSKLTRPFTLGLVLIDLVLHISLMLSFRDAAGVKPPLPATPEKFLSSTGVIYIICMHYLIRATAEMWAMVSVSRGAFKGYMIDIWNIFGVIAIFFTIVAASLRDSSHPLNGLNAFVIGLLWIKVLGFLKVILALNQILYDIRLFMVVLCVCIWMFGDMFHVAISEKDGGKFCESEAESGAMQDFCGTSYSSYLRTYSILLGDFELDDLKETTGSIILFILFTIFGVIVLLNVLIAIISDSYEKATLRGHILFGRARVMFVAQNEALEHFLKPRKRKSTPQYPGLSYLIMAGRLFLLLAIFGTALFTEIWLCSNAVFLASAAGDPAFFYFFFTLLLAVLLLMALWVTATFVFHDFSESLLPSPAQKGYNWLRGINTMLVRTISGLLFGLEKERIEAMSTNKDEREFQEWTGRINYISDNVGKMISEAKRELKKEIMELKQEIHEGRPATTQFSNVEQATS